MAKRKNVPSVMNFEFGVDNYGEYHIWGKRPSIMKYCRYGLRSILAKRSNRLPNHFRLDVWEEPRRSAGKIKLSLCTCGCGGVKIQRNRRQAQYINEGPILKAAKAVIRQAGGEKASVWFTITPL